MRITIVDGDLPYPPNSGKRLRTLNLMLPLADRHDITYIGRAVDATEGETAAQYLADHRITPIIVTEPVAPKSGPSFYMRLIGNLASNLPYSVASHVTPAMREAVQRHAAIAPVDLMQIEYVGYMYGHDGLDCPLVLQAHNVESLIWRRYAETESNPLKRAFCALQHAKYVAYEREQFHLADRVVAVSEPDAQLARSLYGDPAMAVVDNGVDVAAFRDLAPSPASRQVLFLGALDWRPNIDAVEQLLSIILPALRRRVPDATLAIVGRKPSAGLRRAIEAAPGATLFADVPDVRPYLRGSAVMAVPLRVGGGSRLKILESLAASLPVVSTAVGAEGLCLENGRHIAITETGQAFAESLAAVLTDPATAAAQAAAGREAVAARYDWSMLATALERVWHEAVSSSAARRGTA